VDHAFKQFVETLHVMQHAYFRQAEVQVTGRRYTAALEGGFAYDVYETEGGKLWFKAPGHLGLERIEIRYFVSAVL